MMPNGTVAWLNVSPAPASATEINRLRRGVQRASALQVEGLKKNAAALRRQSKRLIADTKRLSNQRIAADGKLDQQMLAGDAKVDKRIGKKIDAEAKLARAAQAEERTIVRRQGRRHLWDSILLTSAAPLFAAYGERGNPLSEQNLTLALSTGIWLVGDEVSDVLSSSRRERTTAIREMDAWSYIAPLGNLLTGWWLFSDRQHEPFVTGAVDDFPEVTRELVSNLDPEGLPLPTINRYVFRAQLDLGRSIASGHIDDFRAFANVPAIATLVDDDWERRIMEGGYRFDGITAEVDYGVLTVAVTVSGTGRPLAVDAVGRPKVAWVVDTRDPKP